ncbi:MAG TPA: DUF3618 domain-containing protein [Natronosporangium sp.]|nr:DUF3618 domain-containing protein [Natronosporangium sp.]
MTAKSVRQTEELRAEINYTRAQLGETMQELAGRMDVPSRMRDVYRKATTRAKDSPAPWVLMAGAGAAVAAAVTLMVVRRRSE